VDINLIPIPDSSCVEEILEGEIVLFFAKNSQAIFLNKSASVIWKLINKKHTVGDIISLLSKAYPDSATIEKDVFATLDMLFQNGLLISYD
jgi:hypothetical protein